MALEIIITDAGRAEIINANNTGTAPVEIAEIGVGTGKYTPSAAQTALTGEIKRLSTIAGEVVADDTIHVTIKDETSDAYAVSEIGLYTQSGTLFAVYSDPLQDFIEKASGSSMLLSVDIVLGTIDAASLTFGDTSFSNPPSSETVAGVLQLADSIEAAAGENDTKAMTPLKSKQLLQSFNLLTADQRLDDAELRLDDAEQSLAASATDGAFAKSVKSIPLFQIGAGIETSQEFSVAFSGVYVAYPAGTSVSLPSLVSATDYKIYAKDDGTLQALDWDSAEPASSKWVGGFHAAYSNGAVVERSLWDLGWRPSCNPRGMTLSPDNRLWVDIYLMDVDYGINHYSRPNATIADGASLPKIPAIYGGNGTTTYPAMTWYNSWDLAIAAGKRLPFYGEFTGFAYGVVERQAVGTDPVTTKYQAGHRSACGVEQVTGCLWQWGADINGTNATGAATWQDIAGGRGDVSTHSISAVLLGAGWNDAAYAGSRASSWNDSPDGSNYGISARGVCDHHIL